MVELLQVPQLPPLEELIRNVNGEPVQYVTDEVIRVETDAAGSPVNVYRTEPFFTTVSHGLQAGNQQTLMHLLFESGVRLREGVIVDAGCGEGLFEALAPWALFTNPNVGRRVIVALDRNEFKLRKAKAVTQLTANYFRQNVQPGGKPFSLQYVVSDPTDLVRMSTSYVMVDRVNRNLPKVAMIWSNQVLHWVRSIDDKMVVFEKFYDML